MVVSILTGELYLEHQHENTPLDPEYRKGTMEHVYALWGKQVHLRTINATVDKHGNVSIHEVVFSYDGKDHTQNTPTDRASCSGACTSCSS